MTSRAETVQPLGPSRSLHSRLAELLSGRVQSGEWESGERLPSEADLRTAYGVSRTTIRTALKVLESQGLVITRQGQGTFVAPHAGAITAGLQQLQSISATIAAQGYEPGMDYRTGVVRPATEVEADRLRLTAGSSVLSIERAATANRRVVAFSYDVIPVDLIPKGFEPSDLSGSIFRFLEERARIVPSRALAEVHAVVSKEVGWGRQRHPQGLYVLLDQIHFEAEGKPVLYSRTYFIEGRFQFTVARSRTT